MEGELGVWWRGSPGFVSPIGSMGGGLTSVWGAPLTIESIESAMVVGALLGEQ